MYLSRNSNNSFFSYLTISGLWWFKNNNYLFRACKRYDYNIIFDIKLLKFKNVIITESDNEK